MAIIWGSTNQKFNAPIGVTPVTHLLNVHDDGGLPLDAARINNNHGSLTGRIAISTVGGWVELEVDTDGLAAGVYWFESGASTDGGSNWTDGGGGQIEVYTEDVETINIGAGSTHTLTADLPSSGKTSLVINFGSSTSVLDGSASRFKIVESALLGRIQLNGPGQVNRLGSSSDDAINIVADGDGRFKSFQVEYGNSGAIRYQFSGFADGHYDFRENTVLDTSVVPVGAGAGSPDSFPGIIASGGGVRQYPNLCDGNKVGHSWFELTNLTAISINDNVAQGDRCGFGLANLVEWHFNRNYIDCKHVSDWSQVSAVIWDGASMTPPLTQSDNIVRGGQYQLRILEGGLTCSDWVFADLWAETSIDAEGHATLDTIIERAIFLPTNQTTVGITAGWVHVRGDNCKIRHCTAVGDGGGSPANYPGPFIAIAEGAVLEEYVDNLATGLRIIRGVAGDAAVAPVSAGGVAQDISGTPLRPSSAPNRITTATNNGWFDNDSGDADDYEEYGVGTVTGSPGTDDVSADPEFLVGSYAFPDDADIWDGTATVEDMLADIRAAFTLGPSSPMRGAASDDTHIGAVQLAGVSAALTGTALAGIDETDVVAGGKTIIVTLDGDTFIPS